MSTKIGRCHQILIGTQQLILPAEVNAPENIGSNRLNLCLFHGKQYDKEQATKHA
jgi:hypothetical protein